MMDAPNVTDIVLPGALSDEQRRLLVRYTRLPRSVTWAEWRLALAAFDLLHGATVTLASETLTFQVFYLRSIDTAHSTPFIEELLATVDVEADGSALLAVRWREILAALTDQGVVGDTAEVRALLAYCLYWWRSFGKGYIREVAVFRDLERSGVAFEAHDLRHPAERRSTHDLKVLGWRGDVKSSTYFIHTARSFPLRSDFYIVRLWDEGMNRWLDLVLLKPEVWRELDGKPTPSAWDSIARVLPTAAQVEVRGEALVVVPYTEWKARVRRKQSSEGDDTS